MEQALQPDPYVIEKYHQVPLVVRLITIFPSLALTYFLFIILLDRLGVNPSLLAKMGRNINLEPMSIVAFLSTVLLDFFFIGLWFTHKQIYVDLTQSLLISKGRFFFFPWKSIIPSEEIVNVGYRKASTKTSFVFDIFVTLQDQSQSWIAQRSRGTQAEEFVRQMSTLLHKPIERI